MRLIQQALQQFGLRCIAAAVIALAVSMAVIGCNTAPEDIQMTTHRRALAGMEVQNGLSISGPQPFAIDKPDSITLDIGDGFTGAKQVAVTIELNEYVKDGLSIHWDGAHNTRAGHDDTATVWEDLSGNGVDLELTLSDVNHWVDGGFALDATQFPVPQSLVDLVNGDGFTFEMVLDDYVGTGTSFGTILSSANDNFSYFHRVSNGVLEFKNAGNARPKVADATAIFQGATGAIVFDKGELSTLYVDGAASATFTPTANIGANNMWLGHAAGSRKWSGVIKAVRLYNRPLRAEEIAFNHAIDQSNRMGRKLVSASIDGVPFENGAAELAVNFVDGQAVLPLRISGEGPVTLSVSIDDLSASLSFILENAGMNALSRLAELEVSHRAEMTETQRTAAVEAAAAAVLASEGTRYDAFSATYVSDGTYQFTITIDGDTQSIQQEVLLVTDLALIEEAAATLAIRLFPVDETLPLVEQLNTVWKRASQIVTETRFAANGGTVDVSEAGELFTLRLSLNSDADTVAITPNRTVWTENFDNVNNGTLPSGWHYAGSAVRVEDGKLFTAGGSLDQVFSPMGIDAEAPADFVYEADIRFVSVGESTRWGALMFAYDEGTWFQTIARQNATASNGVEFAQWTGSGWNVIQTTSFAEALDSNRPYRFKAVYSRGAVTQYINDKMLLTTPVSINRGLFGFSSSGVHMEIDNIQVTLTPMTTPVADFGADIYAPVTAIPVPPTVALDAGEMTPAVFNALKRPATVIAYPDANLDIYAADGAYIGSLLNNYLEKASKTAISAFYLRDAATASALEDFLTANGVRDVFVMADADNAHLVQRITDAVGTVSGIIEFPTLSAAVDESDLWDVVATTNMHHAKIAVIPAQATTADSVLYLQRRGITVWVRISSDEMQIYTQLTNGVDGIVTAEYMPVIDAIESFTDVTLLRKPLITGHRGMPSRFIENTLRSAIGAYEAGADTIENDVYITTDGVIVVNHDSTTERLHTENLTVENATWAELAALKFKSGDALPNERMSTLEEYFVEFKGTEVVHFIEIKSSKPEIVAAIRDLARAYDVEHQCVVISFNARIVQQMRIDWPEVTTGFLGNFGDTGSAKGNIAGVMAKVRPANTTFNPSFSATAAFTQTVYDAKHRGVTIFAWTINGATIGTAAMTGLQGITTNEAWRLENTPWTIQVEDIVTEGRSPAAPMAGFSLSASMRTRIGEEVTAPDYELIQLSGPEIKTDAQGYYVENDGLAVAMLRHLVAPQYSAPYYIYSNPFSVRVVFPVSGVSLEKTALTLVAGDSETLVVNMTPEYATEQELIWRSSDDGVAVVDENGQVTAIASGTASITVTTVDGGFSAEAKITVVPVWQTSTVYSEGDVVGFNGLFWQASWWTMNQTPGDPFGPWQQLATADDGTSLWTATTIYTAGDIVLYQGILYQAQWWTRNQTPGQKWSPWKVVSQAD